MKGIYVNFFYLDHFLDSSRDVAMATDFGQNLRNDLHSTRLRSETDWNIAIPILSLIHI